LGPEDENKDLRPRTRTQLFVLEAPRGRGQVFEDTLLIYNALHWQSKANGDFWHLEADGPLIIPPESAYVFVETGKSQEISIDAKTVSNI